MEDRQYIIIIYILGKILNLCRLIEKESVWIDIFLIRSQ